MPASKQASELDAKQKLPPPWKQENKKTYCSGCACRVVFKLSSMSPTAASIRAAPQTVSPAPIMTRQRKTTITIDYPGSGRRPGKFELLLIIIEKGDDVMTENGPRQRRPFGAAGEGDARNCSVPTATQSINSTYTHALPLVRCSAWPML